MAPILFISAAFSALLTLACGSPIVQSTNSQYQNLAYHGTTTTSIESFLNIPYGNSISGKNRFKHAKPWKPSTSSTIIDATAEGPACPQPPVPVPGFPLFSNVTNMAEECLNLRITRPAGTETGSKLPVMVYIYGGGYSIGQIYDKAYTPDGLVRTSEYIGKPVIYVAMNYRLAMFGFAASHALKQEKSLNSALLDQRLALEWVQANIADFGGDPDNVTIFGESAGGTSVSYQLTAYGGLYTAPFHKAIVQSGNPVSDRVNLPVSFVESHFNTIAEAVNCTTVNVTSAAILECVRAVSWEDLNSAIIAYDYKVAPPFGFQTFGPIVDHDFIPMSPSAMLSHGAFYRNIPTLLGWNTDDGSLFTPHSINSTEGIVNFIKTAYPGLSNTNITSLLSLYPESEFENEFWRGAKIYRDLLFTCGEVVFSRALTLYNNNQPSAQSYLYQLNQTSLEQYIPLFYGGITHFADIFYVFNELDISGVSTSASDENLAGEMSSIWAGFAYSGQTSWEGAFSEANSQQWGLESGKVFVLGGSEPGLKSIGEDSLVKRCSLIGDLLEKIEM